MTSASVPEDLNNLYYKETIAIRELSRQKVFLGDGLNRANIQNPQKVDELANNTFSSQPTELYSSNSNSSLPSSRSNTFNFDKVLLAQEAILNNSPHEDSTQQEQRTDLMNLTGVSSQSGKIFSGNPNASLPTSISDTYNQDIEYNEYFENIRTNHFGEICKQGYGMHKTVLLESKDVKVIKKGDYYNSNIYVFESKQLLDYINERVTDTKIAVKMHNWFSQSFLFETVSWQNNFVDCFIDKRDDYVNLQLTGSLKNYLTELECYKKLNKELEFNSVAYDQRNLSLLLFIDDFISCSGFTNIFNYIENQLLPKDLTTLKKAQKQLEIIHRAGLIHHDIAERNILYSKDEKVYIIDFSSASYEPDNERGMRNDMRNLEYIFKEVFS